MNTTAQKSVQTGRKVPLSNAERQRRFRERCRLRNNPPRDDRTYDMFDVVTFSLVGLVERV
jgi:hypothetical protein